MGTPMHRGDVRPHRFARSTSILQLESGAQRLILGFLRISRMASKDYSVELAKQAFFVSGSKSCAKSSLRWFGPIA